MGDSSRAKYPQKPFELSKRESQRLFIEEELEKFKEALGGDYEAVLDFAKKFFIAKELGLVYVFYDSKEREEVFRVDERAFLSEYVKVLVEGLLYKSGLASKLEDVNRAREAVTQTLFKLEKGLRLEELGVTSLELTKPFGERLKFIVENAEALVNAICDASRIAEDEKGFKSLSIAEKASIVYKLLSYFFDFVRVWPLEPSGESTYFVLDDNVLREVEEVIGPVVGKLVSMGLASKGLAGEVEMAVRSTTNYVTWDVVDKFDKLNLRSGVLDLKTLKLSSGLGLYFRHRLDIYITQDEIDEIVKGVYDIRDNEVYRLWRAHFDEVNWEYLITSIGTWLAPYRFRHLLFIVGPRGCGKSTLLEALTSPIRQIVANVSLRSIVDYTFGLEGLIGKQINVYSERGEVVLRNIDVINNLVGERDFIEVHRKHKPPVTIRSLKAMAFAMNDPPMVYEYGGETMMAFLERLSVVQMRAPEGFKPIKGLRVDPKEAFRFLLYCRCALEANDWEVKKMDEEALLDYLMEATNSALRFLKSDVIIRSEAAKVKGSELYDAYVSWCKEQGIAPMGRNEFYATVSRAFPKVPPERTHDKTVWFRGLTLNPKALRVAEG